MATYGEIVTEILDIIPNPERESLVRSKVNQILRYVAGSADYWKALEETTIGATEGVDPATRVQQILVDINFRCLLYVKYPDTISKKHIKVYDAKDVVDLQRCQAATNVAYMSGSYLRIQNSELTSEFNIGSYVYPPEFATDGSEDANSNWLTIAVPGLIVDLTSSYMLNLNGDNEDSARIQRLTDIMQVSYIRSQVNGAIVK